MMHEGRTQVVTRSIYVYEGDTMAWLRRPLHIVYNDHCFEY